MLRIPLRLLLAAGLTAASVTAFSTIQIPPDGATWTTVATQTGYPRPGAGGQTFAFAAATARYVRVTGTTLTADQFGAFSMQLAGLAVA